MTFSLPPVRAADLSSDTTVDELSDRAMNDRLEATHWYLVMLDDPDLRGD